MTTAQTPFTLSDALVDDIAELHPILATFMGVAGHDHRLDDFSPEGARRGAEHMRAWRDRFAALAPQTDRWSKLAATVALDWIDQELDAFEHGDYQCDLNSISSPIQNVRMVFDSMDLSSPGAWARVASRFEAIPVSFEGYRRTLAEGLSKGRLVAARQIREGAKQARVHGADGSFFDEASAKCREAGGDEETVRRLASGGALAKAAYVALADWLEGEYLPRAKPEDGVGRDRYLREMRRFIGSTPNPEETCAWGWEEVRRIRAEMERLAEVIAPGAGLAAVMKRMAEDPSRASPDRESFIAVMRERQAKALPELDGEHLDIPDEIRRVDVKIAPPGGPLGAYYVPPSEDFSRPGAVWYSLHGDGPFALWDEVSTAYHEGFPGHHLQCGTQVSLTKNLSRFHRVAYGYSGYAEGWALYVEQLMRELGYYEKPEYELGMLANQMMRACRVVFDIGAHLGLTIPADAPFHPGESWSFDLGVEMMSTLGGLSPEHAKSEVTRYLGWPAQAISYKVGQRVMLSLREEFLASQRGSLKDFHMRVLSCGNVSFDILREQVMA